MSQETASGLSLASHPVAQVFPELPPEELKELAEDITANGLLEAITLDTNGRVLDGRNRLRACELAGIEPTFETYEGEPVAFVIAQNIHRRHLTKDERAWIAAKAMELSATADKRGRASKVAEAAAVDRRPVSQARTVLRKAPGLAAKVDAGEISPREAYDATRAFEKYPDLKHMEPKEAVRAAKTLDQFASDPKKQASMLRSASVPMPELGNFPVERLAARLRDLRGTVTPTHVKAAQKHLPRSRRDAAIASYRSTAAWLTSLADQLGGE